MMRLSTGAPRPGRRPLMPTASTRQRADAGIAAPGAGFWPGMGSRASGPREQRGGSYRLWAVIGFDSHSPCAPRLEQITIFGQPWRRSGAGVCDFFGDDAPGIRMERTAGAATQSHTISPDPSTRRSSTSSGSQITSIVSAITSSGQLCHPASSIQTTNSCIFVAALRTVSSFPGGRCCGPTIQGDAARCGLLWIEVPKRRAGIALAKPGCAAPRPSSTSGNWVRRTTVDFQGLQHDFLDG